MNYSVVLLLLLATANAAQNTEENEKAGVLRHLVRRRNLGDNTNKQLKKQLEEDIAEIEVMGEEMEALTVDVGHLLKDVEHVEAEIVEEEGRGGGNKRGQASGSNGEAEIEKRGGGGEKRGQMRDRDGDGDRTRHEVGVGGGGHKRNEADGGDHGGMNKGEKRGGHKKKQGHEKKNKNKLKGEKPQKDEKKNKNKLKGEKNQKDMKNNSKPDKPDRKRQGRTHNKKNDPLHDSERMKARMNGKARKLEEVRTVLP